MRHEDSRQWECKGQGSSSRLFVGPCRRLNINNHRTKGGAEMKHYRRSSAVAGLAAVALVFSVGGVAFSRAQVAAPPPRVGHLEISPGFVNALSHPELVAVARPNLGALRAGDHVSFAAMRDAPIVAVTLDGTALTLTRAGEETTTSLPGALAPGAHQLVVEQTSKAGPVTSEIVLMTDATREVTSTPSVAALPGRLLAWATIGFDTTLTSQADRSPAFTLDENDDNGVTLTATGSGNVTWLDNKGDPVPPGPARNVPKPVKDFKQLVDKTPRSPVVFESPGAAASFRHPMDRFWCSPAADGSALDVNGDAPRVTLAQSEPGSVQVQWPDGRTVIQQVAPGARMSILDSVATVNGKRTFALVQANDRVFVLTVDEAKNVRVTGTIDPPAAIAAPRYLALTKTGAIATIPTLDGVTVTPLTLRGK